MESIHGNFKKHKWFRLGKHSKVHWHTFSKLFHYLTPEQNLIIFNNVRNWVRYDHEKDIEYLMKIASVCKTADFDFEDLLSSLNVSHKQFKTPLGI